MKIAILLSTYNGEKYLEEQLESLMNQDLLPNKIIIRDDGSNDETINILEEFSNKYDIVEYYQGENIGPAKSFFELINRTDEYDYYALCDQDDVWFSNKLSSAINTLKNSNNNIPLLYMCRFTITDDKLNVKESNMSKLYSFTDFPHSLIYHTAPGCTFVFNNVARTMIIRYDLNKEYYVIHDEIIHKVVAMFGEIILDNKPYMYYRQHSNNVFGLTANRKKELIHRIKNFIFGNVKNNRSKLAANLLKVYGSDISDEKKEILDIVANYVNNKTYKKRLIYDKRFKSHTYNDLFFIILVLANYI